MRRGLIFAPIYVGLTVAAHAQQAEPETHVCATKANSHVRPFSGPPYRVQVMEQAGRAVIC